MGAVCPHLNDYFLIKKIPFKVGLIMDKYTLHACYGDWFFSTTVNNLNGEIVSQSGTVGGANWILEVLGDNGDEIQWTKTHGEWQASLKKIANGVWQFNSGSHPYLLIYEN